MWWSKPAPKIRPLFDPGTDLRRARLELWVDHVFIGDGLKMLATQAVNEAVRHCRIGMVTKKI